ncbi:ornithine cyclodeaminase [Brachybacterium sp. EE-P12]|uniref:Ornithine cyclodeaminase n=1 Tax=Candidatus Brachybacterium intestinipullorum TaxID=2838512 RepID=A0A9D2TGI0_9MICO|nr:ornithine cyclodeaminase [Brachybacterium sp. EE-P12]HJC68231.1 ornithine cyclodeaminase [Candidatus Brachybacterium intestinipullorum]
MPHLLDVPGTIRWIRRDGTDSILAGLVRYLESDLLRWEDFEKVPRLASHTAHGVIELMPITDGELYSFKYVNGHPHNPARGLQTVTAFGVLADVDNGYPILFAEMTLLTALRTAATSALAARELARPGARVHALIGAGSQAEFQALAMRTVLGIEELRVMDLDEAAVEKVRRNLEPLGFRIHATSTVDEALEGADVITTCTADKTRAAVLQRGQVRPGVHLNAIGGDCPGKTELDPAILEDARVVVEYEPQTRVEGEIQQLPAGFGVTELWQILAGQAPGRTSETEVTVLDSVGFALGDFSALRCALDATEGTGLLGWIDLIADPDDPKDLFSLVTDRRPTP